MACGTEKLKLAVLFATVLCSSRGGAALQKCDIMACRSLIKSVALSLVNHNEKLCLRSASWSDCANKCMREVFSSFDSSSDKRFDHLKQPCNIFVTKSHSRATSRCILSHLNRLLACVAVSKGGFFNNIKKVIFPNAVICGKVLSIKQCPHEVLSDACGKEAVGIVEKLFKFIFEDVLEPACNELPMEEIMMPPAGYHLNDGRKKMSSCLDSNSILVNNCIDQYLQDSRDVKDYACGDEGLTDCISSSVSACIEKSSVRDFLTTILSFGSWKCDISDLTPVGDLDFKGPEKFHSWESFEILNLSHSVSPVEADHPLSPTDVVPKQEMTIRTKLETSAATLGNSTKKAYRPNDQSTVDMQKDQDHNIPTLSSSTDSSTEQLEQSVHNDQNTSSSNCGMLSNLNFILIFLGLIIS